MVLGKPIPRGFVQVSVRPQAVWPPAPPPLPTSSSLLPGTAHPRCPPAGLGFLPSVETKGEVQVTEHWRCIFQSSGTKNRQATMNSAFQCLSGQEMMTNHPQQSPGCP